MSSRSLNKSTPYDIKTITPFVFSETVQRRPHASVDPIKSVCLPFFNTTLALSTVFEYLPTSSASIERLHNIQAYATIRITVVIESNIFILGKRLHYSYLGYHTMQTYLSPCPRGRYTVSVEILS